MKFPLHGFGACLLAATLAACGGGGGGPSSNADGGWLSFDPATPSVTQYEGESTALTITATASRSFSAPFNLGIVDRTGLITTQMEIAANSQLSYSVTLHSAAALAAGSHATTLEVRVCEDAPQTCAKPLPGSPWRVPLSVQVKSKAEAAARLTLSTTGLVGSTYPGEVASFGFEAQMNKELAGRFANLGVVDPNGIVVAPSSQMTAAADGRYVFKFSTPADSALAVGTHGTTLQLRMCLDDVRTCLQPVAGSPWTIPLTLTVKQPVNLTPLKAVDGLGPWSNWGGNAAHTGFVDASFDPAVFTRRWRLASAGNQASDYGSVAVDGNRVFLVRHGSVGNWELLALSEDSGELAWKVDLGGLHQVNPPAAANGRVYLTSTGHADSFMWVFDQASGSQRTKLAMTSQWPRNSAPTVSGTDVYAIDGYTGGVSKFADAQGGFGWRSPATTYEGWSPAVDGRYAYLFSSPGNTLQALDVGTGARAFAIGEPYNYSTYFVAMPVVLTDTNMAIVTSGKLMAFDLAKRSRAWALEQSGSGNAAYGNGTVYAFDASGQALEARSPATGALLWSAASLGGPDFGRLVVTRNLAFASSPASTVAVDLATRKVVWSYPLGGSLAISPRGVLYIYSTSGVLAAVNLR